MCPSQKQERAKGHLSKETFIKLIEQLQGKIEIVEFALYGEILIHPDYDWFIKYAKSKNIKTSVSTNASFLTAEHSRRLIDSGLDHLIISIDDVSGGQYEDIRKGSQFTKIIKNTQNFFELNNGKIFTVIQKIHMSINKTSTWSYIDEMLPLGADIVRLKPLRDLDRDKKNLRVSKTENIEKIQCPYLWKAPVITWKGQMVPCGNDYNATMIFGNVDTDDITKVWDGKLFQEMRQTHIDRNKESIDLCRGCTAIDFNHASFALSSLFDGLNSRKVLSVLQTLKILCKEF
jgi:radical SAM protein with 4Fe4S-binding SPASM domain